MPNVPWRTRVTEHTSTFANLNLAADGWYHRDHYEDNQLKRYLLVVAGEAIPIRRACASNGVVDANGILEVVLTAINQGTKGDPGTYPMGINMTGAQVAIGDYFWLQTGGPAIGISNGTTITEGEAIGATGSGKVDDTSGGALVWISQVDQGVADSNVRLFMPFIW